MTVYRGKVVSYDAGTHTAKVRLDGSPQEVLTAEVAANIAGADVTVGRRALVDTGDHNNPADAILTAVAD